MTVDEKWQKLRQLCEENVRLVNEWKAIRISAPYEELQRRFRLQDESDEKRREIDALLQEFVVSPG